MNRLFAVSVCVLWCREISPRPRNTRATPALHPRCTRAAPTCTRPDMQMATHMTIQGDDEAGVTLSSSRHAVYRKRKRENLPTRHRRTVAQLASLEVKPLAERTTEEKEAVRNHRKVLQRRERAAATSQSVAAAGSAPPPTRSASPPPAPIRHDSMLLNTADLEGILGRSVSPPIVAVAASSSSAAAALPLSSLPLPLPSPPPASISPGPPFDAPYNPSSSPPAVSSSASAAASFPPPLLPAPSTAVAAASAMSSCSKLKQAILKKRSAMSVLHPNSKRRAEGERGQIKIGREDDAGKQIHSAAAATAGDEEEEKQWEIVINNKIQAMSASHIPKGADVNRRFAYNLAHHLQRITTNVRLWVSSARAMGCTGTEHGGLHAPGGCPGRFTPAYFFDLTHFAHWQRHKRSNNGKSLSADTVNSRARSGCVDSFRTFMTGASAHGRVLWNVCHKVESIAQSKHPHKK